MMNELVLGKSIQADENITLPYDARKKGTYIIGIQGMGKSNLLLNIALTDISNGHGVCLLTPHSELIHDVLIRLPEDRIDDVILFDPSDDHPLGLNIFEWSGEDSGISLDKIADDVVVETFKRLWGDSWGPRLEELMYNVARTALLSQTLATGYRPTLAEFSDIVGENDDTSYRMALLNSIESSGKTRLIKRLTKYWNWLDGQSKRDREQIIGSTLNKARPFADNELVAHVVGQEHNPIDMKEVMDEGKILLVDLGVDKLGRGNVELIGSLMIGRLFLHAMARDVEIDLRPFHIIADEFGYFATPAFASLQDEGRKYSVDIAVAHQRRGQLGLQTLDSTRTAGNWIVFNVNPEDARELSEAFDSTPPEPELKSKVEPLSLAINPWNVLNHTAHEDKDVVQIVRWINEDMAVEGFWNKRNLERIEGLGDAFKDVEVELYGFPDENAKGNFVLRLNEVLYDFMVADLGSHKDEYDSEDQMKELTALIEKTHDLADGIYAYYWHEGRMEGLYDAHNDPSINGDYPQMRADIQNGNVPQRTNIVKKQVARTYFRSQFALSVYALGLSLHSNPVYTRGGTPQEQYDNPRSYSDVTEEWKNRFAHLPQFEAWCRIQAEGQVNEHHIRTIKAIDPQDNFEEFESRIRERSRSKYGMSRPNVEAHLDERQTITEWDFGEKEAGADDEPPVEQPRES